MCPSCGKSYDRARDKDVTIMGAIVWAANRARLAERRAFVRLTVKNIRDEAKVNATPVKVRRVCANPACGKPWKNGQRQCLCAWQGMALWKEVPVKGTKS
jgi:hypothetical protein